MPFLWENVMGKFFRAENLCFGYLKKPLCLKDVNFSAEKNDRVLILALDDKGKTSLIKTLSGFDEKFFGKVFLENKEIRTIPDGKKNVSIIFDEPILLNSSIEKNIDYIFDVLGRDRIGENEKLELLKNFGLEYPLKTKINKLSIFEKFKLCFLRVFVKESRVVFVDNIFKHNFAEDELNELKRIFDLCLRNKLLFVSANSDAFVKHREFFDWLKFSKVLYLNNAIAFERKSIDDFLSDSIDLDACEFDLNLTKLEGFCVRQDGAFYLSFDDKFILKLDKGFDEKFEKLKLSEGENEDIVLVFENSMQIDLTKNTEINKLLADKKLMVFSKIDRSRVV